MKYSGLIDNNNMAVTNTYGKLFYYINNNERYGDIGFFDKDFKLSVIGELIK